MKYCSNCGSEIDEKAVICVKCGVPVTGSNVTQNAYTNQTQPIQPKQGHGAATASLVLGILGLIAAIITLLISLGVYVFASNAYSYTSSYYSYDTVNSVYTTGKLVVAIGLTVVPGLLSLIGLPLGLFCRSCGKKIAGIVLNAIAVVICIGQFILIMFA